jgi:hypothetical protein
MNANSNACCELSLPEGKGLLFVRFMIASCFFSWTWFRTEAPQARRKIPKSGRKDFPDILPETSTHDANADNVTESEMLIRINSGNIRVRKERKAISGFSGIQ